MVKTQPSDYLALWNPWRLRAFFQYCDCANMATANITQVDVDEPRLHGLVIGSISAVREQARIRALELFDPFIPSYPRSWPKRPN